MRSGIPGEAASSALKLPLFDIDALLLPLRPRLQEAAVTAISAGVFILGPEVEAFEREFASYLGVKHVVGVANGTEAITIGLRAMGVGPGDEVIVPSFTFYASAEAIVPTGARPVFCDVDPETMMVTPETVRPALSSATKAVVAVHLFGNVAPVTEIEALGVPVLEDTAQAAGSRGPHGRPGAFGTAATFSFYPSKNLGCLGDGGAIATSSDEVAEMARILRFHGSRDRATWDFVGYNSRLDELQAAFLRVLLPELDEWSRGRDQAARHYRDAGLGELVTLPSATDGAVPAWHLYVIRSKAVDAIAAALSEAGIGNKIYYRPPLHRHPAMVPFANGVKLPVTDELAMTHLAIPISPNLTSADAAEVTRCIEAAVSLTLQSR
jgi:dTDP-3-amino-3,4,6-trideoxy-alpha-D-glucose transaminase